VHFQSSGDERCVFRRVPAVAPTNHAWRMAFAVYHEPFTALFAPDLKILSLLHTANNARCGAIAPLPAYNLSISLRQNGRSGLARWV
jgi:hypothetical protein